RTALRDVDTDRGHRNVVRRLFLPSRLCRGDPRRGNDLPGIVLATGEEITLEQLRAKRFRQVLQWRSIIGARQKRIVIEESRDEGARPRRVRFAVNLVDARPFYPAGFALNPDKPAQFAGSGGIWETRIEPGRKPLDDPETFGAARRVRCEN